MLPMNPVTIFETLPPTQKILCVYFVYALNLTTAEECPVMHIVIFARLNSSICLVFNPSMQPADIIEKAIVLIQFKW